ncbi:hypothetical protein BCR39DRAFT_521073 [Naematelia encephala]|uniref:Cytidyltransferase-like domain-containing protein n=1 Tax=Naematelia encephala TaxID=71784 RepID=A0A1Y2BE33_9TREE|nr:hypothetical protein BCR39DRAFT_521073 [Naematelia encephala]
MTSNGFKSPAPVLPAMGLHSFHNDSPPFNGAGIVANPEPEYLSLDDSQTLPPRPQARPFGTSSQSAQKVTQMTTFPREVDLSVSNMVAPMPIRIGSPLIDPQGQQGGHHREVSNTDENISLSRSRRLVSGYMFGNPPSPVDSRPPSTAEELYHTPPSLGRDSPPLVDPRTTQVSPTESEEAPFDVEETIGEGSAQLSRKKSEKSRDRETGYDALNGLNDGEADLDESAPQAEGSTEAYLRGAGGEAGQYGFPRHRLRTTMKDESKIPIVIVACGSFSPPTYLHLRMFEMAKDEILESQTYEIMAGYYSPVSSYYKKSGLAPAVHRVRMCELAVEHTSTWLMVDPWEAGQSEYQRTAVVLEHFDEMLNSQGGGIVMSDGKKRRFKIMLLAGGDLIESFGEPGVWSEPDLHIILGRFGCLIVERAGSDVWAFLLSHDILYHHRRNVIVIKQLIYNDISSTKVRLFVRRGMSIKYLLPNSVIQYIYDHKLYRESEVKAVTQST